MESQPNRLNIQPVDEKDLKKKKKAEGVRKV